MHPVAQRPGQLLERCDPRARQRHHRALGMKRPGDRPADPARCAGHQRRFPRQIKHVPSLSYVAASARTSSGPFTARTSTSLAMRRIIPLSALPAPTSTVSVTPFAAMKVTLSRQRTRPVTCATRSRADLLRIGHRRGLHIRHQRHARRGDRHLRQRRLHRLGGRLHQRAMERRAYGKHQRALRPARLGDLAGPLHRRLVPRQHHLRGIVVVRRLADLALGRLRRHRRRRLEVEPQQSRHRADAHRHRILHRRPAQPEQPRRIRNTQSPGGTERRILAQRMPRHEGRSPDIDPLGLQRPHRRERRRHQRRLRIPGQREIGDIALPDQGREPFAQRRIHLVEHRPRLGPGLGQIAPHADGLRPLPGKYICPRHLRILPIAFPGTPRAKRNRIELQTGPDARPPPLSVETARRRNPACVRPSAARVGGARRPRSTARSAPRRSTRSTRRHRPRTRSRGSPTP